MKIGHPDFCKKQAEKKRVILYSKREETRLPLLFLNNNDLGFLHPAFFKKQAEKNRVILYSEGEVTRLPLLFLNNNDLDFLHFVFFKKQGARFLRLVGAD